jgi:hypothetical protein
LNERACSDARNGCVDFPGGQCPGSGKPFENGAKCCASTHLIDATCTDGDTICCVDKGASGAGTASECPWGNACYNDDAHHLSGTSTFAFAPENRVGEEWASGSLISFTATPKKAYKKLVITFPKEFDIRAAVVESVKVPNADLTPPRETIAAADLAFVVASQQLTITRAGGADFPKGQIDELKIKGVKNPNYAINAPKFFVATIGEDDAVIESKVATGSNITPGELADFDVSITPAIVRKYTDTPREHTIKISFTTNEVLPPYGTIKIMGSNMDDFQNLRLEGTSVSHLHRKNVFIGVLSAEGKFKLQEGRSRSVVRLQLHDKPVEAGTEFHIVLKGRIRTPYEWENKLYTVTVTAFQSDGTTKIADGKQLNLEFEPRTCHQFHRPNIKCNTSAATENTIYDNHETRNCNDTRNRCTIEYCCQSCNTNPSGTEICTD